MIWQNIILFIFPSQLFDLKRIITGIGVAVFNHYYCQITDQKGDYVSNNFKPIYQTLFRHVYCNAV